VARALAERLRRGIASATIGPPEESSIIDGGGRLARPTYSREIDETCARARVSGGS
jgi:hypothetical protein